MTMIYVRVCKAHRIELVPDTLTCPVGHECGDEDFLSRDKTAIERTEAQSRAIRDGLLWTAGLFDSRGWCGLSRYGVTGGKRYVRVVVQIRSTSRGALESVCALTGVGSIRKDGGGFRFQALNSSATRFLLVVRPFLRVKKNVVDKLLAGRVQGRCE